MGRGRFGGYFKIPHIQEDGNGNFAKLETVNSDSLTYTDNMPRQGKIYLCCFCNR
jgi:hypothetical protein